MKLLISVLALTLLLLIAGCSSIQTVHNQILLREAVEKGDEKAVRRLVDGGADVNTSLSNNSTLLSFAVIENKPDLVKFLLDRGAKVNVQQIQGFTPLNECALQQVNNTAQQQTNSVKIAEMLLNHGADPNLGTIATLKTACQSNNFELVKLLVKYGADVNIRGNQNNTPLMYCRSFRFIEFLISKGANVNAQDGDNTVLMVAGDDKNITEWIKMMKLLIEKGANVNAVVHPHGQKQGETVLDQAIHYKYPKEIEDFLRSHGAKTADELGANAKINESSGSNSISDKETSKVPSEDSNIKVNESNMQTFPDTVKALAVMQIVQSAEKKLLKIKGYTAEVERQILDVNGGFDKFIEEQTVRCPDKMFVKGKVAAAHNKDIVGNTIITVIDGNNIYSYSNNKHYNDSSKSSFKSLEQNGGPSLRMYMAYLGNLTDPFTIYKMETLKLESENADEWVLTADYKQLPGMPYWLPRWTNRITIDKKSGLIKKLEALIKELEEPVILLDVKSVSTFTNADDVPESIFKIDPKTGGKF